MKDNVDGKLEDWVMFPRSILRDFLNGNLSRNEFIVLMYLRLGMNPYGISRTSFDAIRDDILSGTKRNYANQILLGLKNKRLLFYYPRAGRRGSFEVHFGEIILPNKGGIRTLDKFFQDQDRASDPGEPDTHSAQSQRKASVSQSLDELRHNKDQLKSSFSQIKGRASNNDNNTEKNIKNKTTSKGFNKERYFSYQQMPQTQEEEICRDIAEALGEPSPRSIVTAMEIHGFHVIEKAWVIFQEEFEGIGKEIKNKGAYFTSIIKRFTKE